MTDAFRLAQNLIVSLISGASEFRYEQFDYSDGKLTVGFAYVDEDHVLVLVVDPFETRTVVFDDDSESATWLQTARELPVWEETSTYRWEYAPGPWIDPVEDSDPIPVMGGL